MKLYVNSLIKILIVQNVELAMDKYDEHELLMRLYDHRINYDHLHPDLVQLKLRFKKKNVNHQFISTYSIEKLIKVLNENIPHNQYSFVEYDYKYLALNINF
jgi:hypothetical protein